MLATRSLAKYYFYILYHIKDLHTTSVHRLCTVVYLPFEMLTSPLYLMFDGEKPTTMTPVYNLCAVSQVYTISL
jgi:hypothetical protein